MTTSNKKEYLQGVMAYFCHPCENKDGCDNCECLMVMNEATKALDKAEKYKWHDLRKNPDDLPKTEDAIIAAIKFCGKGSEYHKTSAYTAGRYEQFFKRFNLEANHKRHDEYNPYVPFDVIAWRYIEPFEEVEK